MPLGYVHLRSYKYNFFLLNYFLKFTKLDGKRVALIGKKRIRLVGTASLQISDVQLEDEGWYTCEVTDNTNHMTRSSSYLKIIRKLLLKLTAIFLQ